MSLISPVLIVIVFVLVCCVLVYYYVRRMMHRDLQKERRKSLHIKENKFGKREGNYAKRVPDSDISTFIHSQARFGIFLNSPFPAPFTANKLTYTYVRR